MARRFAVLALNLTFAIAAHVGVVSLPVALAQTKPLGSKATALQTLALLADELICDNLGNLIVARGNVELYYDNHSLIADEVAFDRSAMTVRAIGNITMRDPKGSIWRGGAITLTGELSKGLIESQSLVGTNDSISARRAVHKDGSVDEPISPAR